MGRTYEMAKQYEPFIIPQIPTKNGADKDPLTLVANSVGAGVRKLDNGLFVAELAPGGLTSAGVAFARGRDIPPQWIGYPRRQLEPGVREALEEYSKEVGYNIIPVDIPQKIYRGFYDGYANGVVWFALHGRPDLNPFSTPTEHDENWGDYIRATKLYADEVVKNTGPRDRVWIHDYQLMLLAHEIRQHRPDQELLYFHHVPFPDVTDFHRGITRDHERNAMLRSLLNNNLVGFQTPKDVDNFIENCKIEFGENLTVSERDGKFILQLRGKNYQTVVGAYPISIDPNDLENELTNEANAEDIRDYRDYMVEIADGRAIIASVHRADPMKGTEYRLDAFYEFLKLNKDLGKQVLLVEVAPQTRKGNSTYDQYYQDIQDKALRLNRRARRELNHDRDPILLHPQQLDRHRVAALYSIALMGLATTLADGMNLQPAEQAMLARPGSKVLIGKDIGAAWQFAAHDRRGVEIVDPKNYTEVAEAIRRGVQPHVEAARHMRNATRLPPELMRQIEQMQGYHEELKQHVQNYPVDAWGRMILNDAKNLRKAG